MTRILVTGGLGFLGSHLVDALLAERADVTVVDELSSNVVDPASYRGRCAVLTQSIDDYLPRAPDFDQIFHLAERAGPAGILPYAGALAGRSARAMERVLALATPGRTRILYVSSSEVYGRAGELAETDDMVVPPSYTVRHEYALAKMLGEATALNAAKVRDLVVNVVRPFNIAGPRQSSAGGFVVPRFFEAALAGTPLTVFGDGQQLRALTHVADTVESLLAVMRAPARGVVVNSGNPANVVSILDLARQIRQLCGSASSIELVDPTTIYGPLYAEAFDKVPCVARIKAEVGWAPSRPLAQLLQDTLAYYRHGTV